VSTSSLSGAARRGALSAGRSRRLDRFSLQCEPLEPRQLLSVFQGGPSAATVLNQPIVQPNVSVAPLGINDSSPTGLSPSQITTAYGVNQITFSGGKTTGNGQGQTIAIVDAYNDPKITSDLGMFDAQFGLSAPPSFTVDNLSATTTNAGWALEESLDVEWAHAIAPAANIVLVEAANSNLNTMFSAVTSATKLSGVSVVSMSWGTSEFSGETSDDSVFSAPGITFVASSGDNGSSGAPEYPSASPNVLAVGGTSQTLNSNNSDKSETGWSGSGGGYSAFETQPGLQTAALNASGLETTQRTTPDVSWDANPSTGVSVYASVPQDGRSGWLTVGGTSVGAPSWSGLIAIADQGLAINGVRSLGNNNAQTSLYQLPSSDFHDITTGSNGGYKAGLGYDLVTGIGTPIANQLVPALVSQNTPATSLPVARVGTPNGPAPVLGHIVVNPGFTIQTPAVNGTGISSSTDSTSSSTSTSTSSISITALNPNTTSTTTVTLTLAPVTLVPAPLPPPVIHLGTSAAPVTAQSSIAISLVEEQPTSITHFGQGPENERGRLSEERLDAKARPTSWIDVVEPFQPPAPAEAPKDKAAPPPAPGRALPLPVLSPAAVDAVLELFDIRELTGSINRSSSRASQQADEEKPTWNLSALCGAAAVVVGGYRFALHGSDQLSGRWLPRRTRARRWTR
jgi:hypothetical protein